MTLADVAGMVLYGLIALAAGFAGQSARRFGLSHRHVRCWGAAVVLFMALIVLRLVDVEDHVRDLLRGLLTYEGEYGHRRAVQRPLVVAVLLAVMAMALLAMWKWAKWPSRRLDRLVFVAQAGMLGFIPLFALRIISFHAMDVLLYKGPIRLNWLLDGGFSLLVGGAAVLYTTELRRHAGAAREQDKHGGRSRRSSR